MAAIDYGIDLNGRKTYATGALGGRTYICPYCGEEIHVVRRYNAVDYFAHKIIPNRTPQQMMCPGYTGQGRIEDDTSRLYITNGGVPVYLNEYSQGRYELIAKFPQLSEETLRDIAGCKVEITGDGREAVYSAENLHCYRIKTQTSWINVKCTGVIRNNIEVKKKWEWGIRGISVQNDFFYHTIDGGCRLAQHANVVVGKEYLFCSKEQSDIKIDGIISKYEGILSLNNMTWHRELYVYSLIVNEVTESTIAFIQTKGYQLIESDDEIIPLWPPASIEGKDIIYHSNMTKGYFYHKKWSNQMIYSWQRYPVRVLEENNIFELDIKKNVIVATNYDFNSLAREIRYYTSTDDTKYGDNKVFIPTISIISDSKKEHAIDADLQELLKTERNVLQSDIGGDVLDIKGNYVKYSSKKFVQRLAKNHRIVIDFHAYGIKEYLYNASNIEQNETYLSLNERIIYDEYAYRLYNCWSDKIPTKGNIEYYLLFFMGKSDEIYKLLLIWHYKKSMPRIALTILKDLEIKINGH